MKWAAFVFWICGVICLVEMLNSPTPDTIMQQMYLQTTGFEASLFFIGGCLCTGFQLVIDELRKR